MNKKQFSNEPVKKALSETTRAISKKNDLTINFENEATKINQNGVIFISEYVFRKVVF